METILLPEHETKFVVDHIVRALSPCTIFAFGYRSTTISQSDFFLNQTNSGGSSHHFYVVVFSNKVVQNGGTTIANVIAESSNKAITASMLLHKVTDLITKQPGQQWFFDNVLRYGQRLCLDTAAPPYLLHTFNARDVEADRAFWLKCVAVAQFNLHAASETRHLDVELCKIALLHTAVVQAALGLIRVFLGYTPNEFGLTYLLQLCGHFTDLPARIFQQSTEVSIKRYKRLCAPPSMLFHWTRLNVPEQDFEILFANCQEFLGLANEVTAAELERLETSLPKTIMT